MDAWNTITGRTLQWNNMRDEAYRRVRHRLRPFVSSRLNRYPTQEKLFRFGRNALFAYYFGATNYVATELDDHLARYKSRLMQLNAGSYGSLICSMHMWDTHYEFLTNPDGGQSWYYLLTEGIGEIYDRPKSYVDSWYEKIAWFAEEPIMRLGFRLYDELTPLLDLPADNFVEMEYWLRIASACGGLMRKAMAIDNWDEVVTGEINAS